MKKVIVVGAGASGLLAAIAAAGGGASVTILEGMEKPGKKLLMTGNGRCNLTNLSMSARDHFRGAPEEFIACVLQKFGTEDTLKFFKNIGLLTTQRENFIYPVTGQAASVLEVLLLEAGRLGVRLKYTEKVTDIEKKRNVWLVRTAAWEYEADAVILACGSRAVPATGSDGSGYLLAQKLGHHIEKPMAALVPLKIKEAWIRKMSGLRMQAVVILHCGQESFREAGELQWTDYGISGIVVFQLSRYAVSALEKGETPKVILDLFPMLKKDELFSYLKEKRRVGTAANFFEGILPGKAIAPLLSQAGIPKDLPAKKLSEEMLQSITRIIKELPLTVSGSRSFEQAQVCQGGVDTDEIDPQTMQSKKAPGIYITGELLNVDGICGGYNLQWAWSTGYIAGTNSAKG
ncbi:MAG: NAD(P)/FAD-dependent oxidoreductase [Eubacteriales bacterium]|nr:NAD(P)/FAD-dependent oxidoreductase [Eubacteriales bacterium]